MRKLKESPMVRKLEESLVETVTELKKLFINVDKFVTQTAETVEESVGKVIDKTSEEIQRITGGVNDTKS